MMGAFVRGSVKVQGTASPEESDRNRNCTGNIHSKVG